MSAKSDPTKLTMTTPTAVDRIPRILNAILPLRSLPARLMVNIPRIMDTAPQTSKIVMYVGVHHPPPSADSMTVRYPPIPITSPEKPNSAAVIVDLEDCDGLLLSSIGLVIFLSLLQT